MVSKKKKRRVVSENSESHSLLHSFISSIQSPQGLNTANLKKLYAILLHLNNKFNTLNLSSSKFDDTDIYKCGVYSKFKDIYRLSDVLFSEVERRFEGLLSDLCNYDDVIDVAGNGEVLMLLLRCCLLMLVLVEFNHEVLVKKGKVLISVLRRLVSFELNADIGNGTSLISFKRLDSGKFACSTSVTEECAASKSSFELSDSCRMLLCALLEVFADELLVHKSLRQYFVLIDSTASRKEKLFNSHFGHGNIGSVLEVVCAHFAVSVSNEQAFANFVGKLFWWQREDFRIPEISLPAALSLLLNPALLSAPRIFQSYLILLVSEVIGVSKTSEMDVQLIEYYLTALERSVILYTHMSSFHGYNHHSGNNDSFVRSSFHGTSLPNFESFLLQTTVDKLHILTAMSKSSWTSHLSKMSDRKNSDLVASSISYVTENICNFDESCKDDILLILNCIILGCSSDDVCVTLSLKEEISPQDFYFVASILKLISSSMLQLVRYVRCVWFSGCCRSSGDLYSCKEYNCLVRILGYFERCKIHLPMQNFLHEMMQSHLAKHKTKWMLLQLLGLLSLSYANGVDFLAKGCLFTLMTLLNLFVVEDGDLRALRSLCGSELKSFSSESSENVKGALAVRSSTQRISSKFQKIQKTHLRTQALIVYDNQKQDNQTEISESSSILTGIDSSICISDNTQELCNGEKYLKCVLGKGSKKSDLDDLADFIVCESGKDYADWLKDQEKFREWKFKKRMKSRWKKKKLAWRSWK